MAHKENQLVETLELIAVRPAQLAPATNFKVPQNNRQGDIDHFIAHCEEVAEVNK